MQIDTDCNVKCSLCHVFQHRQIDTGSNVKCSLCHAFQPKQTDTDSDIRTAQGRGWHVFTDNNNDEDNDEEKTFETATD